MKENNKNAALSHTNVKARLQAWSPKVHGRGPFLVIFNGKVFENKNLVMPGQCPGNLVKDGTDNNPWRLQREATPEEIGKHGNAKNCTENAAVEAWHPTIEGAGPFSVIFKGNIYKNASPVPHGVCPGNLERHGSDNSPWRFQRAATPEEIEKHGNTMTCSEFSEVIAWKAALEGEGPFLVIFDSKVYKNISRVDKKCPGNLEKEGTDNNPWRLERDATQEEIEESGNPTRCDDDVEKDDADQE